MGFEIDEYLIGWQSGADLKIYHDFEVISFIGIHNNQLYTVDKLLNINQQAMINEKTATEMLNALIELMPSDEEIYITSTPIQRNYKSTNFYHVKLPLRIDYAIQVGLGVARSVHSMTEYRLYPIDMKENKELSKLEKRSLELLRLRLYAQLVKGKQSIDQKLRQAWVENNQVLKGLIFADIQETTMRFNQIF